MSRSPLARQNEDVPARALLSYFVITFGIAWGMLGLCLLMPERFGEISATHPGFILAVWSPAFAALAIVAWYGGANGLRGFLSRLLLWRCPAAWYVYFLVGMPLVFYAGAAIKGEAFADPFPFDGIGAMLSAMAFMLILGPVEEFGWRGVALPLMQRRLAPFWAGLALGLVWGLWHLPAFLLSGTPQGGWDFTPFLVGSVSLSVILTPMFNAARGSILIAVLYHFQANNPLWPDAQPYDSYILVVVAAAVTWINRPRLFDAAGAATAVIPGAGRSARRA